MDTLYTMPGRSDRLFINVVHACPNACLFCVDFKGEEFFGFNLQKGRSPSVGEILRLIDHYPRKSELSEVWLCGIGEPLLRYDDCIHLARALRSLLGPSTLLGMSTSGTYYRTDPRVCFACLFDRIQISLNAESGEKYDAICRPKQSGMFDAVIGFLTALRSLANRQPIGEVELSVVDVSEQNHLPAVERDSTVPSPDIGACRAIAASYGWPLKVKPLIRHCEDDSWQAFARAFRQDLHPTLVQTSA